MSEPNMSVTLEDIYAQYGVSPYNDSDSNASDTAVDIDSILFEEMYKEAKKVEITDEEADAILLELTGEIPLKELHAKLKETETEKEEPEAESEPEPEIEPAPEIEPEPKDEPEPEDEQEEENEEFKDIVFEEAEEDNATERVSLFKRIPKKAYIAAACVLGVCIILLASLAFRTVYTVNMGENALTVRSFYKDAEKVLNSTNLEYHGDSKIELTLTDKFQGEITITEPFEVVVQCDGEKTAYMTTGIRVDELLDALEIELNEFDTVSEPLNSYVEEPLVIDVNRVTLKKRAEKIVIPAEVEDKSEGADYTYTKEGVDGEALITYLETYINGKLSKTTEISREILSEAQATVIYSMEHNGSLPESTAVPTEYLRVMDIECTAYYLPGNYTATGKIAQRGYVAVDPTVIPLGTKMFICSADGSYIYGYAQAEDTGSAVKGNIVDLHMDSYEECIIFGRRDLIAYIIEEG